MNSTLKTLFEKVWDAHVVRALPDEPTVLYVDFHLMHEVTSPQAFSELAARGLKVRRPERTLATMDHSTPTRSTPRESGAARRTLPAGNTATGQLAQLATLEANCRQFGIPLAAWDDDRRGIVHVIGPELGLTQPGMTIVCGDSHTSTHGAFGALAFGIGTSEVGHVLATQCLLQRKPRTMEVRIDGQLGAGVCAKDVALAVIARIGAGGGTGHVIEYTGSAVRSMSMEARMTLCNMSIEAGARAGLVAPDDTTYRYLAGRPSAPTGAAWERAVGQWRTLPTDEGAVYDRQVVIDATSIAPMISYGTNPEMSIPVDGHVPLRSDHDNRAAFERALTYMGVTAGEMMIGKPVHTVFLGSCTNARISDLRAAAALLKGRTIAANVRMLVVPGSEQVKRQAEAEGLDAQFVAAGAEWRDSGCSMCIAMNGDQAGSGEYVVSTSNRNFEGRQGPGARTLLASPLTAAASAIRGVVTDPRTML